MVQVAPRAVRHLAEVRNERGLSRTAVARFIPKGTGVSFTFARQPEPGDDIIEQTDLTICVAPEAAERLADSTIDLGKTSLVVVRGGGAAE